MKDALNKLREVEEQLKEIMNFTTWGQFEEQLVGLILDLKQYNGKINSEMLRVCKREDCPTRYYIATRRDQKYCNTYCSQLVATRKWWAAHAQEWRKNREIRGPKATGINKSVTLLAKTGGNRPSFPDGDAA